MRRWHELTSAEIRYALRATSNWPQTIRPLNLEAAGHYTDVVGDRPVPDDLNDYEWLQAQAENGGRMS